MGTRVIVAYRPKPGQEAALDQLTHEHVPTLRRLDLATDAPAVAMRATDGTVIESFEWRDGAMERAHSDPDVLAMWRRYADVCDYVPLRDVAETAELFAGFVPIDLEGNDHG